MKEITISKAPQKMRIEAIKGLHSFDDVLELDNIAADAWKEIFEGIEKSIYNYASWDAVPITSKNGSVSFLRHGLTRSIKESDKLQLTCILVKDGKEIPDNTHSVHTSNNLENRLIKIRLVNIKKFLFPASRKGRNCIHTLFV